MFPHTTNINEADDCEFCFYFTLQAGVVMCVFQGLTLLSVTLSCNIFMEDEEPESLFKACHWICLIIFLTIMGCGYACAFASAYSHKRSLAKSATVLIGFGVVLYLFMSILSFLPVDEVRRSVCVSNKCPDHHWVQDAGWRIPGYMKDPTASYSILYVLGSFVFSLAILAMYTYTMFTFYLFMKFIDRNPIQD